MAQQYPFSDLSELNYSKERRILNEQLFFNMNQRIKESTLRLLGQAKTPADDLVLRMSCECSDASCLNKIKLDIATFDDIHKVKGQYILTHGHDQQDIEDVVAERPDYIIVKKFSLEHTNVGT